MKILIQNFSRLAHVRHAYNFLKSGFKLLHIIFFVALGLWILKRNLNWTFVTLLNGANFHHIPKGIFCMEKNLTEVIENIKEDQHQRKEFYVVTSNKGKLIIFSNTLIYDIVLISLLIASLIAR